MRLLAVFLVTLVCAGVARASQLRVESLTSVEDLSLPFSCDWSYDWDARCYWDDSDRLSVGREDDKVWRAALRFAVPTGVQVVTAELSLWHDGTCVAPRRTTCPCDARALVLEAHPIDTAPWRSEREVELGPAVAVAELEVGWTTWDLSDLVADWSAGGFPNNGVALKLVDAQEEFGSSGPTFASATYLDSSLRPRLTVWYVPP